MSHTTDVDRIVEAIREGLGGLAAALRPPWPAPAATTIELPDGAVVAACAYRTIDLTIACRPDDDGVVVKPPAGLDGDERGWWWTTAPTSTYYHATPAWIVSRIACDDPTAIVTFSFRGRPVGVFTGRDLRYGRNVTPVIPVQPHLPWSFRSNKPTTVVVSGLLHHP